MIIPFKNLINDAYCRDISIKVRSHLDMKRKNGEYIGGFVAYGYQKDPEDKNKLIVDDYAAGVVRDIFEMKIRMIYRDRRSSSIHYAYWTLYDML